MVWGGRAGVRTALHLRATRKPAQGRWTTVRARQGHNTPLPSKRSPPASFKRLLGGAACISLAELFMSDNVIQAAPPNKRLKLAGGDRFEGSGVLCPWRARTVVQRPCAGLRVARSLSAIR